MRRGTANAAVAATYFCLALGCGGETAGSRGHFSDAAPAEASAGGARSLPDALAAGSARSLPDAAADGGARSLPDAAVFADAAAPVDASPIRDASPVIDAWASADAGPDPCADPTGSVCIGESVAYCGAKPFDCTSYYLSTTHPVSATCARFADGARCAVGIGETCFTATEDEPLFLRCLGTNVGCVGHFDTDLSQCVEGLGTCDPSSSALHTCSGRYRVLSCNEGQPTAEDCSDYSPDALCGVSGDRNYCGNIAAGGRCDENVAGTTEDPFSFSFNRCAIGLVCRGAHIDGSGNFVFGTCQPP